MIVNIRGTSGSGKTTLVRRVFERFETRQELMEEGRRKPAGYLFMNDKEGYPTLYVPGHYESACGGCDTIKKAAEIQEKVRTQFAAGANVLYEGLLASEESARTIAMIKDGLPLVVVCLSTPVSVCIERINGRRRERNPDAKPVDEKNTRNRVGVIERACSKIRRAGGDVRFLDGDAAYVETCNLLGVRP